MRLLSIAALLAGLALLGWLIANADLATVANSMAALGWSGAAAVMGLFAALFVTDVVAWALTFARRALRAQWLTDLWLVNMYGEALNVVLPFGSLGGEPFKLMLLKRHWGVPLPESTASFLLTQSLIMLSEAAFVAVGVVLLSRQATLPGAVGGAVNWAAGVLLVLAILLVAALHKRWLARLARFLERGRWGRHLAHLIVLADDIEHRLFDFVRRRPWRFASALVLFLVNWIGGAAEFWLIMWLLGAPIGFADCWIIETAVVLARSATFFVPAHIGAYEAVIVLALGAITGSADVALSVALIRRARELAWSALGLGAGGWLHFLKPERTIAEKL